MHRMFLRAAGAVRAAGPYPSPTPLHPPGTRTDPPMFRRLGHALLYAGTAVCALGALGIALGMSVTISDALAWKIVRAVAFAAPLLVGGTLMACGALFLRAARTPGGGREDARTMGKPAAPRELAGPAAVSAAPAPGEARRTADARRQGAPRERA